MLAAGLACGFAHAPGADIPRVPSPYKMSAQARAGTIRYRLDLDGVAWDIPPTGEQRVVARTAQHVDLRICDDCGDEPAPSSSALEHALQANAWVDSDNADIRRFAWRAAGAGSVDTRMQRLEDAVQAQMRGAIAFDAYRTASQTLKDGSGDCTEAAVLLAASARAVGIPARVAYGLVYSSRFTGVSHAFSPHVWVQAWDGTRWRSYDAGMGRFDSGHIALRLGDGSPTRTGEVMALIRRMRILDAASVVSADD